MDEILEAVRMLRRRLEPAPQAVVDQARAAFSWRGVAASIAGLEFDSAVDDDDLARVRDAGSERRLRFRGAGRVVEVVLVDNTRRLAGQIDPPLAEMCIRDSHCAMRSGRAAGAVPGTIDRRSRGPPGAVPGAGGQPWPGRGQCRARPGALPGAVAPAH